MSRGSEIEVKLNKSGFRQILSSAGVAQLLSYYATRAKVRAESVGAEDHLKFGCGVDYRSGAKSFSVRGWVGAPSLTPGHHRKQKEALSQALHGV